LDLPWTILSVEAAGRFSLIFSLLIYAVFAVSAASTGSSDAFDKPLLLRAREHIKVRANKVRASRQNERGWTLTTRRAQAALLTCSSVTGSGPALGAVEVEVVITMAPVTANS
jgi:hypothetical protein